MVDKFVSGVAWDGDLEGLTCKEGKINIDINLLQSFYRIIVCQIARLNGIKSTKL